MAYLSKPMPYLVSRARLDGLIWTRAYSKTFMENIDQNQIQPNIENNVEQGALQGNNVARNEVVPNGEAQQRHHLSTYSDDEKRWLVIAADEERSRGTGFMMSLKRRWDQKYPEKNNVSKQNLRDNAVRFKKELAIMETRVETENEGEQEITINNGSSRWTNEMKVNLLMIEERERKRG